MHVGYNFLTAVQDHKSEHGAAPSTTPNDFVINSVRIHVYSKNTKQTPAWLANCQVVNVVPSHPVQSPSPKIQNCSEQNKS